MFVPECTTTRRLFSLVGLIAKIVVSYACVAAGLLAFSQTESTGEDQLSVNGVGLSKYAARQMNGGQPELALNLIGSQGNSDTLTLTPSMGPSKMPTQSITSPTSQSHQALGQGEAARVVGISGTLLAEADNAWQHGASASMAPGVLLDERPAIIAEASANTRLDSMHRLNTRKEKQGFLLFIGNSGISVPGSVLLSMVALIGLVAVARRNLSN